MATLIEYVFRADLVNNLVISLLKNILRRCMFNFSSDVAGIKRERTELIGPYGYAHWPLNSAAANSTATNKNE